VSLIKETRTWLLPFRHPSASRAASKLDSKALDQLFRAARTHNGWRAFEVPDRLLQEAVELAKMGPTSANASPLRIVFVRSAKAKSRLKGALSTRPWRRP
jgi:3-hydroxypropanoate dehydrogenase